jgi:hypothetical protein
VACIKFFEARHPNANYEKVGIHPNFYYESSVKTMRKDLEKSPPGYYKSKYARQKISYEDKSGN